MAYFARCYPACCLLAAASFLVACGSSAPSTPAQPLLLVSYAASGTQPSQAAAAANTPVLFNGAASYNVGTGLVWANPIAGSSWISVDPASYPTGGVTQPNGVYTFTTTFMDRSPESSSGTITVLADDTADVFLNSTQIAGAAAPVQAVTHCTVAAPNCIAPSTYTLSGFVAGTNTLTFKVHQEFLGGTGIDFAATVNGAAQ